MPSLIPMCLLGGSPRMSLHSHAEGGRARGKRAYELTATSTPSAHMCPLDIGSRCLLDACSLPSLPISLDIECDAVWPGFDAAGRGQGGRRARGRHTSVMFSKNVGRSRCYRAVITECGLVICECGSDGPDTITECGLALGVVIGPTPLRGTHNIRTEVIANVLHA
jgi:hypothetical protein